MTDAHQNCSFGRLVDQHFELRSGVTGQARLRGHLPGCTECRERYDRLVVLASIDKTRPAVQDRLAFGLGLDLDLGVPRGAAPLRARLVGSLAAACVVTLVLVLVSRPSGPRRDEGFQVRGAGPSPELHVYRIGTGPAGRGTPQLAAGTLGARDELAFAFAGQGDLPYLMLFGVDEHAHIYWYHPAWTDPATDPESIVIGGVPAGEPSELSEAIAHSYDGRTLMVHAVFSRRRLRVTEVESLVAADPAAALVGPLSIPESVQLERPLVVQPFGVQP